MSRVLASSIPPARLSRLAPVRAEARKVRRAAPLRVALIAPLPFCALGLLASGVIPGRSAGVVGFGTYGWCYWYTLGLPVAAALIVASVANLDARHRLRSVLGLPIEPARIWWAKAMVSLGLMLASCTVVGVCSGVAHAAGANAPGFVASAAIALIVTAASWWMIPAGLMLACRFGMLAGIAVPLLAQIALGIVGGSSGVWWLVPSAVAFRAPSPFSGVEFSGIPLAAGSPSGIIDATWVAGLAVAVGVGVLLTVLGARWFSKREAV